MPSSILQQFDNIDIKNQNDFSQYVGTVSIIANGLKVNHKHTERQESLTSNDSFEEGESEQKNEKIPPSNDIEYCITNDNNTLTISEGEKLKIVQKNDDNLNSELW